jgi:hypothetical protein
MTQIVGSGWKKEGRYCKKLKIMTVRVVETVVTEQDIFRYYHNHSNDKQISLLLMNSNGKLN